MAGGAGDRIGAGLRLVVPRLCRAPGPSPTLSTQGGGAMFERGVAYYRGVYRSRGPGRGSVRAPHVLPPGSIGYVVPRPTNGSPAEHIPLTPRPIPIEPKADPEHRAPRFVIHLPVVAVSLERAADVAYMLAQSLAFMPEVDGREATVSPEDMQHTRTRVFCDRLLNGVARCPERYGHKPACGEDPTQAE